MGEKKNNILEIYYFKSIEKKNMFVRVFFSIWNYREYLDWFVRNKVRIYKKGKCYGLNVFF